MNSAVRLTNIHPGEVLSEEFMKPLGITAYRLAKAMGISQTHVGEIIRGGRSVTAATALRLAAVFGTSAAFWLNMQTRYDLEAAREKFAEQIAALQPIVPVPDEKELMAT